MSSSADSSNSSSSTGSGSEYTGSESGSYDSTYESGSSSGLSSSTAGSYSSSLSSSEESKKMATTDAPEEFRHIYLNDAHANAENKYTGNGITTSKYTVLTFLPKNLFEQFRRVANLYFLVIAVLQLLPLDLSPISPITSILPLMFVLSVTAGKEIYEDYVSASPPLSHLIVSGSGGL
eukprot:TRINITY_DN2587_c0_g3_i2.p1 TRINITY_DN2587_c0_g3~~TRINITY_DN2587_c0_g3_i2.p1  ORF type:complete len:178 (+),score=21.59 TRINITY_DN2587_c0_g3_i2:430-963(+)